MEAALRKATGKRIADSASPTDDDPCTAKLQWTEALWLYQKSTAFTLFGELIFETLPL